ncbi:MAG TPA: 2-C-methyl-D-erythritol 4-phosphate cytidylyltransferase [Candidatus Micrarchaeia archaeon]|nr:2-C-methyl-D-erythritol 4-phosphate cytidylyltransferase [Candidatus Micrarchaeia archaeon]
MTGPPGPVAALVPAAGGGSRFGGAKLWAPLGDRPVLAWTLAALADLGSGVDQLVVAAPRADHGRIADWAARTAGRLPLTLVEGGPRRQDSVLAALDVCTAPWVVVHDAARPGVRGELVARVIDAARREGAATAVLPAVDTTCLVRAGAVELVLDRERVAGVQTPQAFRTDWLRAAHAASAVAGRRADDDASLVLAIGHRVAIVPGDPRNRKLTLPGDLLILAADLTVPAVAP